MRAAGSVFFMSVLIYLFFFSLFVQAAPTPNPGALVHLEDPGENLIVLAEKENIILVGTFDEGMKKGVPRGWELDDKKQPVDISLVSQGKQWAVRLASEDSAFGLYREQDFDIQDYPWLNWEWKVDKLPDGGDFRDKDKDDQAGQIYISFGSLSFFNKPFVKAVGYYWSSQVPVGTEGPCPTWGKSKVVVLQSGSEKLGKWVKEKRNVYQDYTRLFEDDDPNDVSAVRIYTNSQHTQDSGIVFFRNIYFSRN